jgi:hypothetical protein
MAEQAQKKTDYKSDFSATEIFSKGNKPSIFHPL